MATTDDLYEAVKRRECILFLGAGVHYPPPGDSPDYQYPVAHRPPLGAMVSHTLAAECLHKLRVSSRRDPVDKANKEQRRTRAADLKEKRACLQEHRDNLQRVSWFYELHHQRQALVERVSQEVDQDKRPSAVVRALAELDFPIVITTNYDRLFERALGLSGKLVSPIVYEPDSRKETVHLCGLPRKDARWLFKMHGCVSKPESIVITDEDYIHFVMRMRDSDLFHPVPDKIRVQLGEWPILFVGYSLLDYNLRLLFQTLRWWVHPSQRPATFSLDLYPDLLIRATYGAPESQAAKEPLVTFIARDIWKFVPILYKEVLGREMPQ